MNISFGEINLTQNNDPPQIFSRLIFDSTASGLPHNSDNSR
jgi:hypothetical protein